MHKLPKFSMVADTLFDLGSIPSEFFATTDDSSFNEFLKRSDILICSLPSTSKTKFLLTKERLGESSAIRPGPTRLRSAVLFVVILARVED